MKLGPWYQYRRFAILPLAGLALGLYYGLVFVRLDHQAASLDLPLHEAWRRLASALEQTNATSLDFQRLTNQLTETRQALAILETAKKEAATRLELSSALETKLNAPFQLVDYQNDRSQQMDDLEKDSRQQHVAVEAAVFAGFPEHTAETTDPALLWPALGFAQDLLNTALRCKVSTIHSLETPLVLTNAPGPEAAGRWDEIPLQMEFTASSDSALRVLQSLPLRADEIRAAGLPPAPPEKAPLFIDRLILKKQSPDKLDEVRVWIRVIGFVHRE